MPAWLGVPMSGVYGFELGRRNRRFDRGVGVIRLDRPVVSVGNLSVGGVGKTPMVARIVGWLRTADVWPCIAMRGYKAKGGISDEAELHRRRFLERPTPVVAQPDRLAGLRELFDGPEGRTIDAVVLDDGFQHRKIARDLDIVLLDATRPLSQLRLLPAGYWREPAKSLRRADAVVITHAELASEALLTQIEREVEQAWGAKPTAVARHQWKGLKIPGGGPDGGERRVGADWLKGKSVVGLCGIGRPEGFLAELDRHAGEVVRAVTLSDHHALDAKTLRAVGRHAERARAEAIVVTEKDWVKIEERAGALGETPVVVAEMTMRFDRGGAALERQVLEACGVGNPVGERLGGPIERPILEARTGLSASG
ncbi:MAG: tetraacyldisaccharide 4'-kinase [Planctomycetota bacterium]